MNEQREITAASVELQLGRTPAESRVAVTAEKPLAEDTWYWLVVEHDEGLRVLDPDLPNEGRWYTHFYTGSAPRVIRVEVPVGAKPEDPYAITLSEPVDVSAIVQQNFLVSAGKAVAGCVLQGVECWGAQSEWRTEIIFYQTGLPAFQPELEVRLANAVTGNKSVGETKNVSKHTATPDGVSVTLDGWKERAGVHTWVDIIPPPLP